MRPYRISGRAIWYLAGYWISKKAGLSGRISGASLVFCCCSEGVVQRLSPAAGGGQISAVADMLPDQLGDKQVRIP
jgi:hypothetical protein